ncbi:MAG: transposase [Polaromonas sp.]|nr:transposase [Polaromonas sp.]
MGHLYHRAVTLPLKKGSRSAQSTLDRRHYFFRVGKHGRTQLPVMRDGCIWPWSIDLRSSQAIDWDRAVAHAAQLGQGCTGYSVVQVPPKRQAHLVNSDRGSQYCSHEFQDPLTGWGIRSSMSMKINCWNNLPTESFSGRLKAASLYGKNSLLRRRLQMQFWTTWLSITTSDCNR